MKNGPLFLLGLFAALTISWAGLVMWPNAQLGHLTPYYDDGEGNSFPQMMSGIAAQGQRVYTDVGCAACHTQQVRRPDFGSDQARGWGDRQSVARDYIYDPRPQLGAMRFGPDLANYGARKPAPERKDVMKLLYAGSPTHPSFRFLFDTREVVGERSDRALDLDQALAPRRGYEVVPTERAEALTTYLLNLKQGYEYPEAHPATPEKPAEAKAQPAAAPAKAPAAAPAKAPNTEASPATEKSNPPGKNPEQAVPAAAPDEKKKQTK